jgi:hypothetical protein
MPVSQSRQENAATKNRSKKKIKNIALTEIAQRISRLEMTAAGDSARQGRSQHLVVASSTAYAHGKPQPVHKAFHKLFTDVSQR